MLPEMIIKGLLTVFALGIVIVTADALVGALRKLGTALDLHISSLQEQQIDKVAQDAALFAEEWAASKYKANGHRPTPDDVLQKAVGQLDETMPGLSTTTAISLIRSQLVKLGLGSTIVLALLCAAPVIAAPADALNLHTVSIARTAPADVADWPATVAITRVTFSPSDGLMLETDHALPQSWKWLPVEQRAWRQGDSVTLDNYQYTVWLVVKVNGSWQAAGFVQMWEGRAATGAPLPSDYADWWGDHGSVLSGVFGSYVPSAGDAVGIMLTAGDARGNGAVSTVRERSNIVLATFPANDSATFAFATTDVPPAPTPTPVPPNPQPIVTWTRDTDLDELIDRVTALEHALDAVQQEHRADAANADASIASIGQRLGQLEGRSIPATCSASVFGVPIHCSLGR